MTPENDARVQALLPFEISVCGIEELCDYAPRGVSHVLSLLDPDWPVPEALAGLGASHRLELRFHDIIDAREAMVLPRRADVEALLRFGREMLREPPAEPHRQVPHLLVHCHAGISRSTASMILLVAQAQPARSAAQVVAEVVRVRPRAWPNLRILELGDPLLGRGGALIEAARGQYAAIAARDPEFVRMIESVGRGREVPPAAPRG